MTYKASAIISCYKSARFINHKIKNINESSANMQIIIIECNNGKDIKNLKQTDNMKIKIFNERISLWKAMNVGIKMADYEYIVQANTDDLVHDSAYTKQIEVLNNGYDIVYFDYLISNGYYNNWDEAEKHTYSNYKTPDKGYSTGNGLGMFPMWRKSLHEEIGYFDENLEIFGDSLFWHKLMQSNKKFYRIPETLGIYAQRHGYNLESNIKYQNKDKNYLKILNTKK